MITVSLV